MLKNTAEHYGSIAKLFHWAIAILVFCMLVVGFLMVRMDNEAQRSMVFGYHKLVGLAVLALIVLRLMWALFNIKPALPQQTPQWQRMAERTVHFSLYALIIVMPLSGWVMSTASGYAPKLGRITFVLPVPDSRELATQALDVHFWLAVMIIMMVALHVGAALYHHFIKKDAILKRML